MLFCSNASGCYSETDNVHHSDILAIPVTDAEGRAFTDPAAFVKSVEQGAATSVWCAASPQLDGRGGVYCESFDIAPVMDAMDQGMGVRPYAIDLDLAERLCGGRLRSIGRSPTRLR